MWVTVRRQSVGSCHSLDQKAFLSLPTKENIHALVAGDGSVGLAPQPQLPPPSCGYLLVFTVLLCLFLPLLPTRGTALMPHRTHDPLLILSFPNSGYWYSLYSERLISVASFVFKIFISLFFLLMAFLTLSIVSLTFGYLSHISQQITRSLKTQKVLFIHNIQQCS